MNKKIVLPSLLILLGIFTGAHTTSAACLNLGSSLGLGSRDSSSAGQVSKLQQFLMVRLESNWPTTVSPAPTGYFGKITETAVKNFQASHSIINYGTPSSTGYGAVGPRTRTLINSLSCTSPLSINPQSSTPVVSNSPASVSPATNYVAPTTQTPPTTSASTGGSSPSPSPAGTTSTVIGGLGFESYTAPNTTLSFNLSWPIPSGTAQTVYGGYKITPALIIPANPGTLSAIYLVGPETYQLKPISRNLQQRYLVPTTLTAGLYKVRIEIFDNMNNLLAIREGGPLNIVQDNEIANAGVEFVIEPTGALWLFTNSGVSINVYNTTSKAGLLDVARGGVGISVDAPLPGSNITFGQNYELRWHAVGTIAGVPFVIDKMTLDVTDTADNRQGAILFNAVNTGSFIWDTVSYKQFCTTMTFDAGHHYRLLFSATAAANQNIKTVWYESGTFNLVSATTP